MVETIWKPLWILLLVLNYAAHVDTGSVYRHDCIKDGTQDGSTERTTAQASSDSGFVPSQESYFQETQDSSETQSLDFGATGSSVSGLYSYTSSFKPSTSTSKPVPSAYQQAASAQPVPSAYQQRVSEQPVQTAYQRVSSAQPAQSSYQSGIFSPSAGFGSSAVGTEQSVSSLYSSQDDSYTSSYKPSLSTLRPAQSTYQQGVSYRPAQSSLPSSFDSSAEGTSGSRAYSFQESSYTSSFQPLTSGSKPALSTLLQKAASAQPVQSSSPSSFVSPNVGLDFGATGSSVSGPYSYTSSFKPSTSTSKPGQSGYQQAASAQPVQSSSSSSFVSPKVGLDFGATGSSVSGPYSYTSSFKPSTSTSKPGQSSYQQAASAQPVPSAYQQAASAQPVPSAYQQAASAQPVHSAYQQRVSEQPVQTAYQRVSSAQPVQSSYQSGIFFPSVGFGSSAVGTGQGASSLYSSQDDSYTSSYKPSFSTLKPAQSTYQQGVSYKPAQSSLPSSFVSQNVGFDSSAEGTSGSRAYSFQESTYSSSFQPLTSASKPALSSYQQAASAQPALSAYQQAASAQPVQSSSPSRFVSNVGLDFGATGSSVSGPYSYTSSFKPSTRTSKPVQSSYQWVASAQPVPSAYQQKVSEQLVQTLSQRVSSDQPVQSSYRSGLFSPSVGFDSSVIGMGSSDSRAYSSSGSSYPSGRNPPTSVSKPVESPFQQLALAQPAQSSYPPEAASQNTRLDSPLTEVVESVWRNDYSSEEAPSGLNYRPFTSISTPSQSTYRQVTAAGSRSVYTPSDSVALPAQDTALRPGLTPVSAQAFRSPYSYAQAVSSLDNSEPSAGSSRLTWTQKMLQ